MQKQIAGLSTNKPLEEPLHKRCIELLRVFMVIGGLPEVVSSYIENSDLLRCGKLLDALVVSFEDDFAKYKERV